MIHLSVELPAVIFLCKRKRKGKSNTQDVSMSKNKNMINLRSKLIRKCKGLKKLMKLFKNLKVKRLRSSNIIVRLMAQRRISAVLMDSFNLISPNSN